MPRHGMGAYQPPPQPALSYHEPTEDANSIFHGKLKNGALIAEYRVLGGSGRSATLGRQEEAMQLLRKIGREVRPVMKGRGWTLPLLSEFSGFSKTERDSNLLGINVDGGKKICLRLRHTASDQRLLDDFLPFEDIVGTMLHELSHNVRGPHDDIFYKTLSELEEEWYEARRKGTNVGEAGFDGAGHRLGGWQGGWAIPSGVSIEELREKRRLKFGGVSSSGPQRLGGTSNASNISNKTPSQLAAEAARRRMQMKGACPSSKAEQEGAIKEQEEEEVINGIKVITIDDDDDDDDKGSSSKKQTAQSFAPTKPTTAKRDRNNAKPTMGAVKAGNDADKTTGDSTSSGSKQPEVINLSSSDEDDDVVVKAIVKKKPRIDP